MEIGDEIGYVGDPNQDGEQVSADGVDETHSKSLETEVWSKGLTES